MSGDAAKTGGPSGQATQKQAVKTDDVKGCMTCLQEGHEYWMCRNVCVYCSKRQVNRICPEAPQQYPQPSAPSEDRDSAVVRSLGREFSRRQQEAEASGRKADTLQMLAYMAETHSSQPPVVPKRPDGQPKADPGERAALNLLGAVSWKDVGLDRKTFQTPSAASRAYRQLNAQVSRPLLHSTFEPR